jgi:hypothetical protein
MLQQLNNGKRKMLPVFSGFNLNPALAVLSVPEHEQVLWLGKTVQIQSAGNKIDLQRFRTAPPHTDCTSPAYIPN